MCLKAAAMLIKRIVKNFLPYGYICYRERRKFFRKYNVKSSLDKSKYKGFKPAGGFGNKLFPCVDYVLSGTKIKIKNIFEIGANFAQDADFLMECFGLSPKDVYVFEAHPEIFAAIKKIHSFNAFNYAVYNTEQEITFNVFPLDYRSTGWSSIHGEGGADSLAVKVKAVRMDKFMEQNNIGEIDFLKIDVEGCSYEVLEGFGSRLSDVNCIQIEAEHGRNNFPDNRVLYDEIEEMLKSNNFELVEFHRNGKLTQSDSFWVQSKCIK